MKNISVRLDEKDYNFLKLKSMQLGVSKNEFIRRIIRLSLVENIEDFNKNLKELLIVKRAISNNLNQLTKKGYNVDNFNQIEKELEELWQSLKR